MSSKYRLNARTALKDRRSIKKSSKRVSRKEQESLEHRLNKQRCFCSMDAQSETPAIWREFLCNECLCDGVILSIDNEEIPVHRALISGASAHFAKLFLSSEVKQAATVAVNLTSRTIKQMVKFVYTQECDMDENNIPSLLDAAYQFKFTSLFNLIATYLIEKLTPTNCLGTMRMLEQYSCQEWKSKVFEYIVHHFEDVVNCSKDFNDLSCRELLEIMSDDELVVENEEKLFNIVLQWINHDSNGRRKYLPVLSKGVRYGLMNKEVFTSKVLANIYIKNNAKILKELDPVRIFHNQSPLTFNLTFARPRIPKEILFVIGGSVEGCLTNIVETYDIGTDRWITADTVDPLVRAYYGVCNVGNVIFLVGGYDGLTVYNTMRSFDPVTYKWSMLSCMHQARCHNSAVALNGFAYTMGGFDGTYSLASVELYDPTANQWTLLAPMNISRADCASAVLHGRIYVAGGALGEAEQNSVETYDPTSDQWTYIQPMHVPRSGHSLVAYQGELYALGGEDNEKLKLSSVEKLDPTQPQQHEWELVDAMWIPRHNFPAVVANNKIYVVGGSSSTSLNTCVEFYDNITKEWQRTKHTFPRRSAIAACVLSRLPNTRDYCYIKLLEADTEYSSEPEEVTDNEQPYD